MIYFVSALIFFTLNGALAADLHSETSTCSARITNLKNETVDVSKYCKEKPCIAKCCGENEVLLYVSKKNKTCTNINQINLVKSNLTLDYSDLKIYRSNIQANIQLTTKKLMKDFNVVLNKNLVKESCGKMIPLTIKGYVLENGMLANPKNELWYMKEAPNFCVELMVAGWSHSARYTYFEAKKESKMPKQYFASAAMLVSSFFLLLVLLVYCVLPQLRNLPGMLLMAYVGTLLVAYLMKAISAIRLFHYTTCKNFISPITYFAFLSSFLWLNTMSFDIWWTCRGSRLKRAVHRRGELIKFLWYCLYAWGVAAAMTIAAVIVDNADLTNWPKVIKPRFDTCFKDDRATARYLYAPIGILTLVNIVLFIMTVYNIWLIKKMLDNAESSNTMKNQNRIRVCFSMSLLMGISWALEIVQSLYDDVGLWPYILMNLFNSLIGVAIFVMFIFRKVILIKLCKRFNIKCKFTNDLKLHSTMKSTVTQSQSSNKGSHYKTKTTEDDIEMNITQSLDVAKNDNDKT